MDPYGGYLWHASSIPDGRGGTTGPGPNQYDSTRPTVIFSDPYSSRAVWGLWLSLVSHKYKNTTKLVFRKIFCRPISVDFTVIWVGQTLYSVKSQGNLCAQFV